MLSLENCDLGPDSEPILRNVSLTIGLGEFWAIVGPNGSGKTTLIRSLLGLLSPLRGRVSGPANPDFAKQVAYVPQQVELPKTLPTTPREWVRLGLVGLHLPRNERNSRTCEALEKMQLGELASRTLSRLSAGQRQRAMVARGLARHAQLIALDEPSEGLDATSRNILFEALDAHHAAGGALVLVSHRRDEIQGRVQHVARVEDGHVSVEEAPA